MQKVRAKKHLGQHFLTEVGIARKIVDLLSADSQEFVLEIGPGMGVLTQFLLQKDIQLYVVEIDTESVVYLKEKYPVLSPNILEKDFLKLNIQEFFQGNQVSVIGNFPYNISSQIVFKVLENRNLIPEFGGMFQKEVAQRICEKPGSKTYGILSVLAQAFYDTDYLFTVSEGAFSPPPKVKSGVIRLVRKENYTLPCDEVLFFKVVKTAFGQRRKTLRNSLKTILPQKHSLLEDILNKRPEQLGVEDFVYITQEISK